MPADGTLADGVSSGPLAAAVAILDVVERREHLSEDDGDRDTTELLREIGAVSRALRHPDRVAAVRLRASAPAGNVSVRE